MQQFVRFSVAVLAAFVVFVPASASAACDSERQAFAQEWKSGEMASISFEAGLEALESAMVMEPEWTNAAALAKAANEDSSGVPPAAAAYIRCRTLQRIAELGGTGQAQTRPSGMSSFASGSGDDDGDAPVAASSRQANCELKMGEVHSGALSTDSVTMHNTCTSKVVFVYCVTSANGGGAFSCDRGKFGTNSIAAGGTGYLSISGASMPFEAHWYACVADGENTNPFPSRARWDGTSVSAVCH